MGIDVSLIGPADARVIGHDWYELLEEFYSNPENEKKFQKWLKSKEKKEDEKNKSTKQEKRSLNQHIVFLD